MVKIYSTRKILFRGSNESFVVDAHKMTEAPDWIVKTDTFKIATKGKNRCVNVIENKKDRVAAENGDIEENNIENKEE